jgi:hypothetical protein
MPLVTLPEIRTTVFGVDHETGNEHDAELTRLLAAAIRKIEELIGGPIEAQTVTEYHRNVRGPIVLRQAGASAITSVTPTGGDVYTSDTYLLEHGMIRPAYGYYSYGWGAEVVVVYTAGYASGEIPDEINHALLRYIRWSWSRSHGGSDSYMPGGDDAVPGLGIDGIRKELRFILADLAAGPSLA